MKFTIQYNIPLEHSYILLDIVVESKKRVKNYYLWKKCLFDLSLFLNPLTEISTFCILHHNVHHRAIVLKRH